MRSILGLLSVAVLAALASTSSGAIIALTDTTGDPASVTVLPGDSFDVKAALTLDTGQDAAGIAYLLNSSQSSIFTITARSLDAANPFPDPNSTDAQVLGNSPGLDPMNGADLGGTTVTGNATAVPGTYGLYTFTLATSATAPQGTYQITVVDAFYVDVNFNTDGNDIGTTTYNVTVVPEPVSFGMVSVFLGGLLLRRRPAEVVR